MADTSVYCWGYNGYGGVGDGTTVTRTTAVVVPGLTGVTKLGSGDSHTCAVASGVVKCWGYNGVGTLGNGNAVNSSVPVAVTLPAAATDVGGGEFSSCALLTTGAVYCWGNNSDYRLGAATIGNSYTPIPVIGLSSGVAALSVGAVHACALLTDGTAKCWGANNDGQLGNGTTATSGPTGPVVVTGLTGASSVVARGRATCSVSTTGAAKCWGMQMYGALNNGVGPNPSPVNAVAGLSNGALVTSQASVLVQKFTAAAGSSVSGHVMPIAYSMVNNTTGKQALMVTYDPLAAAAAMFIDQYQAHIDACNATLNETVTELQQQAGTYLWACSNAAAKTDYVSGMAQLLLGANTYLFGRSDGSATAPCTGTTTPSYCIDTTQAHLPYTFVVPNYSDTTTSTFYTALGTALDTYRAGVFGSASTPLHKSFQLAGIAKFDTDTSAVVTTRVNRSGAYGATCAVP
jgi:alpha-tubulin suppressor-like RCC1 family protein